MMDMCFENNATQLPGRTCVLGTPPNKGQEGRVFVNIATQGLGRTCVLGTPQKRDQKEYVFSEYRHTKTMQEGHVF
jgi:hypothetical protein